MYSMPSAIRGLYDVQHATGPLYGTIGFQPKDDPYALSLDRDNGQIHCAMESKSLVPFYDAHGHTEVLFF